VYKIILAVAVPRRLFEHQGKAPVE